MVRAVSAAPVGQRAGVRGARVGARPSTSVRQVHVRRYGDEPSRHPRGVFRAVGHLTSAVPRFEGGASVNDARLLPAASDIVLKDARVAEKPQVMAIRQPNADADISRHRSGSCLIAGTDPRGPDCLSSDFGERQPRPNDARHNRGSRTSPHNNRLSSKALTHNIHRNEKSQHHREDTEPDTNPHPRLAITPQTTSPNSYTLSNTPNCLMSHSVGHDIRAAHAGQHPASIRHAPHVDTSPGRDYI